MRGKRKLKVHWVNGVGEREVEKQNRPNYKTRKTTTQQHQSTIKPNHRKKPPHQMAWEKRRKVELGTVGRKCIGHWVNGIEWESGRESREEEEL